MSKKALWLIAMYDHKIERYIGIFMPPHLLPRQNMPSVCLSWEKYANRNLQPTIFVTKNVYEQD